MGLFSDGRQHASREDYQELSNRMVAVVKAAEARVSAAEARADRAETEVRELKAKAARTAEATKLGEFVMGRFPNLGALESALGDTSKPATLEPGQSPMLDLEAWRRGQLGL